jgi:hypothetical protein
MDLSTNESTLEYLKVAIPQERAHEFIFRAIPLLHDYFRQMTNDQIVELLICEKYGPIFGFVEDLFEEFEMQQSEREMREYRGTKKD